MTKTTQHYNRLANQHPELKYYVTAKSDMTWGKFTKKCFIVWTELDGSVMVKGISKVTFEQLAPTMFISIQNDAVMLDLSKAGVQV